MALKTYVVISEVDWKHPTQTIRYAHVIEDYDENKAIHRVLSHDYGEDMRVLAVAHVFLDGSKGAGLYKVESAEVVEYYGHGDWNE